MYGDDGEWRPESQTDERALSANDSNHVTWYIRWSSVMNTDAQKGL